MAENTQQPEKPRLNRRKQDSPFRRKEDELRYNLFDRFLSLAKWLIALIIVILFFFYKTVSNQNQTDQYQIKLINELIDKVNHMQPNKSLVNDIIPGSCLACHPMNTGAELKIRSGYELSDFRAYVRGEKRIPENSVMPNFHKDNISDQQIERLYNYLKYVK